MSGREPKNNRACLGLLSAYFGSALNPLQRFTASDSRSLLRLLYGIAASEGGPASLGPASLGPALMPASYDAASTWPASRGALARFRTFGISGGIEQNF